MKLRYDRRVLRRLLTAPGVDRAALAKRMRVTRQSVDFWARGIHDPRASSLAKLASVLDVPVTAFFVDVEKPKDEPEDNGETDRAA